MSVLEIARLQFATTAGFHFLFVLTTLGLVTLLVLLQTIWLLTGKEKWAEHTRFWGRLYVINYFVGIAGGVVLELHRRLLVLPVTSALFLAIVLWAGSQVDWIRGGLGFIDAVLYVVLPIVLAAQAFTWWLLRCRAFPPPATTA